MSKTDIQGDIHIAKLIYFSFFSALAPTKAEIFFFPVRDIPKRNHRIIYRPRKSVQSRLSRLLFRENQPQSRERTERGL